MGRGSAPCDWFASFGCCSSDGFVRTCSTACGKARIFCSLSFLCRKRGCIYFANVVIGSLLALLKRKDSYSCCFSIVCTAGSVRSVQYFSSCFASRDCLFSSRRRSRSGIASSLCLMRDPPPTMRSGRELLPDSTRFWKRIPTRRCRPSPPCPSMVFCSTASLPRTVTGARGA